MLLTSFQINNYKSFLSPPEIKLSSGFNIIVGQNNAGKTALVEGLGLQFVSKPHRSLRKQPGGISNAVISFDLKGQELENLIIDNLDSVNIPTPTPQPDLHKIGRHFREAIRRPGTLTCNYQDGKITSAVLTSYNEYPNSETMVRASVNKEARQIDDPSGGVGGAVVRVEVQVAEILRKKIYTFNAQRPNYGIAPYGLRTELLSDASNLAEVLMSLQGNGTRFERFNQQVHRIFPEIYRISVVPGPSERQAQILVWSIDPATERADLAIPLSESGTGISQVLAILYVVLTADSPRILILDEPQSFLHPGAVRKLIEVLKQHPQHQFIVATHSPAIIAAAEPETVIFLRKVESKSVVETIGLAATEKLQAILLEVGARLSDVFGADSILWVEGRTEERCFPLIAERVAKNRLGGTKILGVLQTGDFESKDSKRIIQIYKRLSTGSPLLPEAIGFIFDRESRSQTDRDDLVRESDGKVTFLKRCMYENYLLNPEAIAYVLSTTPEPCSNSVTSQAVEEWLGQHRSDTKYYEKTIEEAQRTGAQWIEYVHGANLLGDLFHAFAQPGCAYEKVEHGYALTQWIAENAPSDLEDITQVLNEALGRAAHLI